MSKLIVNRPTTSFEGSTIGGRIESKFGSRREFGKLLDQMVSRTRRSRRNRKA